MKNKTGYIPGAGGGSRRTAGRLTTAFLTAAASFILAPRANAADPRARLFIRAWFRPQELTAQEMLYRYRVSATVVIALLAVIAVTLGLFVILKRRSERKMREALKAAEDANAAKGTFMSRMSHEIRTPLNAVIGYNSIAAGALEAAKTESELRLASMKAMDCLTKSDIASKHLLTVINDVLDMSAIDSGRIKVTNERFDFRNMISSLTLLFYSQAKEKGVSFEVVIDTLTEEWFVGDQMRVNQIFTNLLSNAIKFTPEGGRVVMRIHQPEAETNAAHIVFEVSDTGIGMSAEFLGHLWTPFEQEDPSISRRYGGTGLGMSITKNLVDIMGGKIEVESEPGKGSTFRVDLTLGRTKQPDTGELYDFSSVNALIVDDDLSTCDYIKLLFTRSGVKCTSAMSGKEAVKLIGSALELGEPFNLCVIDWHMPEMDGVETVKRIRGLTNGGDVCQFMPIIVVSAYDFSDIAESARESGVDSFIAKPLFQSTVFDMLANISGRRRVADKAERTDSAGRFSGARVLLAEDNAMNMEIAEELLTSSGIEVVRAWNGRQAASEFTSSPRGYFDAILMDVHMPELNGYEATRLIRASEHPDAATAPIIAMTADVFAEDVAEAMAAGMNAHIGKPIDVDVLFDALKKFIK